MFAICVPFVDILGSSAYIQSISILFSNSARFLRICTENEEYCRVATYIGLVLVRSGSEHGVAFNGNCTWNMLRYSFYPSV